jgi:hypothetical protein
MKRLNLLTILTTLLITFIAIQPVTAQQGDQSDALDPTGAAFQAELDNIKAANPQFGDDYDLVYPGDVLVFEDGSTEVFEPGEYISLLLLEWLQEQNLDPDNLVAIIRSGRPDILISQDTGTDWPWYVVIPLWMIPIALVFIAFYFSDIREIIRSGGIDVTNYYRNHQHDPSELDSLIASIFFSDIVDDIKRKQAAGDKKEEPAIKKEEQKRTVKDSPKYKNSAPVIIASGSGSTVIFHNHSPEEESGNENQTDQP